MAVNEIIQEIIK